MLLCSRSDDTKGWYDIHEESLLTPQGGLIIRNEATAASDGEGSLCYEWGKAGGLSGFTLQSLGLKLWRSARTTSRKKVGRPQKCEHKEGAFLDPADNSF